jgi:sulfhydrogenase subunit beta (sulfur reductase)
VDNGLVTPDIARSPSPTSDALAAGRLDPHHGLQALLDVLAADDYRVIGPIVRDGVIAYDDVSDQAQLPTGCRVEQQAGRWRLHHDPDDPTRFGWTPGADSWKRFVFPASSEVLRIRRVDGSFVSSSPPGPDRPLALIGARDCEVRALEVLDRVFLDDAHPERQYAQRREGTFVVAVTCGTPSDTCWCTSMGGGPQPRQGFDLRLTELRDDQGHRLLVESGSDRGAAVLARLPVSPADDEDQVAAAAVLDAALERLPVRLPGGELPQLLVGTDDHPRWEDVAARCLSCGNCTMVCPTCFCSSFTDHTPLGTDETVRVQEWVSCFQLDHSNLGGRPVRATTAARYRQWLTHKLQTWPEQFGTSGCVGCGRCTTWCPAGIDITVEAQALAGAEAWTGGVL